MDPPEDPGIQDLFHLQLVGEDSADMPHCDERSRFRLFFQQTGGFIQLADHRFFAENAADPGIHCRVELISVLVTVITDQQQFHAAIRKEFRPGGADFFCAVTFCKLLCFRHIDIIHARDLCRAQPVQGFNMRRAHSAAADQPDFHVLFRHPDFLRSFFQI